MSALARAVKDIKSQKGLYGLLMINLVIGFIGFYIVYFFQDSLSQDLKLKSKNLLAADFAISSTKVFSEDEVKHFEEQMPYIAKTDLIEFFAMIAFDGKQRLASIRAFGDAYPLYGSVTDEKNEPIDYEKFVVWTDPEFEQQLALKAGDSIKIGQLDFKWAGNIKTDTTRFLRSGGLAPMVYISQKHLKETGLIQFGSTVRHHLLYQISDQILVKDLQSKFYEKIKDAAIKFDTAEQKAENSQRIFKYFTDYLGLVSIITIILSLIAVYYLVHWLFLLESKNLSIYKILGLSDRQIMNTLVWRNLIVAFIATVVSLGLCVLLVPAIDALLKKYNVPFSLIINFEAIMFVSLVTLLSPLVVVLSLFSRVSNLNLKNIFNNQFNLVSTEKVSMWIYLLWLAGFWAMAFMQSKSPKIASYFVLGFLAIIIILRWVFKFILYVLSRLKVKNWKFNFYVKALMHQRKSSYLVFTIMTMAFIILTVLPAIKNSIYAEISPEESSGALPALFAFDIQSNQIEGMLNLAKEKQMDNLNPYPMVRARILKLNDEDFSRINNSEGFTTREEEEEMRFRNRGVNLTYQDKLSASEILSKGKWFSGRYSGEGPAEISLEKRFAERIKAKIGDRILFDIQGLEIEAVVRSLRQVRWTTFQPNFFIVFQTGVLEEAPHNFIVSIPDSDQTMLFQKEVVDKWPNISIIDVKQTVKSVLNYVDQMSLALQFIAIMSLVLGGFIFLIILNTQIKERDKEVALLQILGNETADIQKLFVWQFVSLIIICGLVGTVLGMIFSYVVVNNIFLIVFDAHYVENMLLLLGTIVVMFILIKYNLRKLRYSKPVQLLRS